MNDLHFLRPFWLLLLLLLPMLPLMVRHARQRHSGWSRIIPAALLRPLIRPEGTSGSSPRSRLPLASLMLAWTVLSVALAGPAWREAPTPLQQQNDSLVIALNLSLSMLATDVTPDRLTRAKRKIRDLLAERDGALTALVVYAGDAHVVTPLTDDRQTIEGLLEAVDPVMMPSTGNRADLAITRAKNLLDQGARGKGRILLITDDIQAQHRYDIRALLDGSPYPLSALVVGTEAGGPIPLPKQGFIRDDGKVVMVQADLEALAQLTEKTGGASHELTIDNTDLKALELRAEDSGDWTSTEQDLTVSRWQDDGYWLLWLALPVMLFSWRRGALLIVVLVVAPAFPTPAMALDWESLWARPDQRGQALIERNPEAAAEQFDDPVWRGSALYRAEKYEAAADAFARADSPDAHYNLGNALARAGELEKALAAYDQALATDPGHEDARHNRELVEDLLQQQEQDQQDQQQKGGDGDQQDPGDSQNQDSEDQDGQQGSDSQDSGGDSSGQQEGQASGQGQQERQEQEQSGDSNGEPPEPEATQNQPRQLDGTPESRGTEQQEQAEGQVGEQPGQLSQAQEQWLRRIPDDPGGLLRRKFQQQYHERDIQPDESDTPW
ncbi:VWA domain-containing protein [Marinobacter sp.]|uniref:VWA domain-containing protein n=1 Tax=Marinobacter sp. TaxID=50741 RepID=UPI00384EF767